MALSQRAALMGDVPPASGKVRPQGRGEEQPQGGTTRTPLGEQLQTVWRKEQIMTCIMCS